jgi:hypothetical protein
MYVIAIPSYKRAELLNRKTLKTLVDYNIPRNRIFVFVANEEEEKIYKETLDKKNYGHLVVGVKGLRNQRNFISRYFPIGQEIVNLDDDLAGFNILKTHGTTFNKKDNYHTKLPDFDSFIKEAFKTLKNESLFLWGIYPINNPYFMTPKTTRDLRLIVGPCWGNINRHSKDLVLTIDEKEDVERTLQYYVKDGGVIRFNNISVATSYYVTPGGMQALERNRKKDAYESAVYLNKKYPNLTTLYLTKKSGFAEVKLKDKTV